MNLVLDNIEDVKYKKLDDKTFAILLNSKKIDLTYVYIKYSDDYENFAFLSVVMR